MPAEGTEGSGTEDQDTDKIPENPEDDGQSMSACGLAGHEVAQEFAKGSGTQEDPYQIGTIEELNLFSQEASNR